MSNKMFKTKYQASIDNDDVPKLGYLKLKTDASKGDSYLSFATEPNSEVTFSTPVDIKNGSSGVTTATTNSDGGLVVYIPSGTTPTVELKKYKLTKLLDQELDGKKRGCIVYDLADLKYTALTYLLLFGSKGTGDISNLKDMPLTHLGLTGTSVSGDISNLKDMPLTYLGLTGTSVSGDISNLKDMPLTHLGLNGTSVSGDVSTLTKLNTIDLSLKATYQWSSPTARSSVTNKVLQLLWLSTGNGYDFGDDLDNMLIDEAACTELTSSNSAYMHLNLKGNRTSASDAAVETLTNLGLTLHIITE